MANETTKINLVRKRGDTRRHIFIVSDSTTGLAQDISAWSSFVLAVNTLQKPPDISTELFKVAGIFTTDGTDGEVGFPPPGTTAEGSYYYDVQCFDVNSEKFTIAEGKYKITQDISKD